MIRRSWPEAAADFQSGHPHVVAAEGTAVGAIDCTDRTGRRTSREGRVEAGVDHVEADIEVLHRGPLEEARAQLPVAVVRVAGLAAQEHETRACRSIRRTNGVAHPVTDRVVER